MQKDERPFGWDPWHLEGEIEIGTSLLRNADTDDLVGCLEKIRGMGRPVGDGDGALEA